MCSSSETRGRCCPPSQRSSENRPWLTLDLRRNTILLIDLRAAGQSPPILDARLLLENPADVLRELCERLELPFETAMLSWEAGGNPADGVWGEILVSKCTS